MSLTAAFVLVVIMYVVGYVQGKYCERDRWTVAGESSRQVTADGECYSVFTEAEHDRLMDQLQGW